MLNRVMHACVLTGLYLALWYHRYHSCILTGLLLCWEVASEGMPDHRHRTVL